VKIYIYRENTNAKQNYLILLYNTGLWIIMGS